MFTFAWPYAILLLPLPWLVYRFIKPAQQDNATYLPFPAYHLIKNLKKEGAAKPHHAHYSGIVFLSLIWITLVSAMMRPQMIKELVNQPTQARNLMLAVDVSQSMQIRDMHIQGYAVDRLSAIKLIFSTFIQKRQGDQIGLILFGSQAYLQSPFTLDTHLVEQYLEEAQIGIAGKQTAIGDAIGLTIKRINAQNYQKNLQKPVLILITDGANTAGSISPIEAAELAARQELKIYTIGIGAESPLNQSLFDSFFTMQRGSSLDETTLKHIAKLTGGEYFRAKTAKDLERIYALINALEPVESKPLYFKLYRDFYFIPLAIAILIVIIWLLLSTMLKIRISYIQKSG